MAFWVGVRFPELLLVVVYDPKFSDFMHTEICCDKPQTEDPDLVQNAHRLHNFEDFVENKK